MLQISPSLSATATAQRGGSGATLRHDERRLKHEIKANLKRLIPLGALEGKGIYSGSIYASLRPRHTWRRKGGGFSFSI